MNYLAMLWWVSTALAISGAILNAQRRIEGFYLWTIANVGFAAKGMLAGDWSQVVLWSVCTFISLRGIVVWNRKAMQA